MVYRSNDLPRELLTLFFKFCLFIWLNRVLVAAMESSLWHAGSSMLVQGFLLLWLECLAAPQPVGS